MGADWLRPVGSHFSEWTHQSTKVDLPWLQLSRPGASHSIHVFWSETGDLRAWYVNLENPWRRTEDGFEYEDHSLDIWVNPDGSRRWLDEDELQEAVDRGFFSEAKGAEDPRRGRACARSVAVPDRLGGLAADPAWPAPVLPADWDAR